MLFRSPPDLDKTLKTYEQKLEPVRKYVKAEILEKNGLKWRSAIACGTDGPLPAHWNVSGWPTIYVIDPQGKIRYRDVREKEMDRAIDALLAELTPRQN